MNVFSNRRGQSVNWFDKNVARSNQYCPYCGRLVGVGSVLTSDKEHLVARKFVPRGYLDREFNFIFRACRECNALKAAAERHVSTVTLFNSPARRSDPHIDTLAEHKASRDYHPTKRGLAVKDSGDTHQIHFEHGPAEITFDLNSPPQPNPIMVQLLARMQVQGLFALVTTSNPRVMAESRVLPSQQVCQFGFFGHQDWGNAQLVEISNRVQTWPSCVDICIANACFKALLRRSTDTSLGWFWALEWNRSLRIVGTLALPDSPSHLFDNLPDLQWKSLPKDGGRYRTEVPLEAEQEVIFPADKLRPTEGSRAS